MKLRALKVRLVAIMVVTGFCVATAVASAALVSVRSSQNSSLGAILVSSSGRTLYHLSSEKGTIKCTGIVRHRVAAAPDRCRREADRRSRA